MSDAQREIIIRLDSILEVVKDLHQRQKSMEQRQKEIVTEIEETAPIPVVGSFASSDLGEKK